MFEDPESHGVTDIRPYPAYGYVYDLPPEALAGLAYSFHFSYRPPQRVSRYTAPLAARVAEWKAHYPQGTLSYVDDGVKLTLIDRRPGFYPDELTVLDAEHRTLYLACDGVQTDRALATLSRARRDKTSASERWRHCFGLSWNRGSCCARRARTSPWRCRSATRA